MRVLLTGANGYIGTRLLPKLLEKKFEVIALARHIESVRIPKQDKNKVQLLYGDLLDLDSLANIPNDIDAAFYLVHSMANHYKDFHHLDRKAAYHFVQKIDQTDCRQIIYLTGLISQKTRSRHLQSRYEVEKILKSSSVPVTALRSGIIIGSGSGSFEIIRDLVEKLPIMIAPKWVTRYCQPIAISDVIGYLVDVLDHRSCLGKTFDIGGPDQLTYREILQGYAKVRRLHRLIISIPFFSPRLSSYWLIFITSTNFYLARALIESVKNDAICHDHSIQKILPRRCLSYREALDKACQQIANDQVISTWKDSWTSSGRYSPSLKDLDTMRFGCLTMSFSVFFPKNPDHIFQRIKSIGAQKGWYFMNWAWRLRGLIDRGLGGVGLSRGRRQKKELNPGDVVDFWRVLHIDNNKWHLVLAAEMKLPGEAWLEFTITLAKQGYQLTQTAIFRPRGVLGRLYWYACYPLHLILFPGMLRKLTRLPRVQKRGSKK
ncbi:MAG: SDR family oxidoreductase [Chlamydiota bacterium]